MRKKYLTLFYVQHWRGKAVNSYWRSLFSSLKICSDCHPSKPSGKVPQQMESFEFRGVCVFCYCFVFVITATWDPRGMVIPVFLIFQEDWLGPSFPLVGNFSVVPGSLKTYWKSLDGNQVLGSSGSWETLLSRSPYTPPLRSLWYLKGRVSVLT